MIKRKYKYFLSLIKPKMNFFWVALIALVIIRALLPYAVLKYAVYKTNEIPEYQVQIEDIRLHLWRGAYTIIEPMLVKKEKNIPVPFFAADSVDLSVDYSALIRGKFVAKIKVNHPKINFVIDSKNQNEQLSISQEWQNIVKSLFPLNINTVQAINGEIYFRSYTSKPPFDLYLKDINFKMNNIQNAIGSFDKLESSFIADGMTMGGAKVHGEGKFDPLAKQPTFYFNASLKKMPIAEANNFLRHYTKVSVADGIFSLYIEAAAANGSIKGYAKPIISRLKVNDDESSSPIEVLYKGALEVFAKLLENSKQKTVATKIIISGKINDPNTSILFIIVYLISHAYIQTLLPGIDHTVKMKDAIEYSR